MAVQIQIRRGTAANWTSTNPTLAEGELGYETDTGKLKAGDGSTAWTSLGYISGTGALTEVSSDTTPQLGGDLDVNGNAIVSASNGDIEITPNGTGSIILDGLTWPSVDGSANQVLKTAGDGTLSFGDASVVANIDDLTDVSVASANDGEVLRFNGSLWVDAFLDYVDITNNVGSGSAIHSGGTVAAGSITDVIALTNTQYTNLTGGADPNTLYVITDGTTSIADSDDVTITAAATNDFLIYTGSVWEDQTPAQARTALGLGTLATASTITDSYVGHIEAPQDGTYYLDPKVAEAREITGVYFAWTAGGSPDGDIDVQIGGTSVLSSTGRMNSGSSFTGTLKTDGTEDVAADAVITVVLGAVNGVADVTDLRFSVEYTQ